MNTVQKLKILTHSSKYDLCASTASKRRVKTNDRIGSPHSCGICHTFTPDGRCVALFKTLMSNACSYDCKYCMNTSCKRKTIATFEPDELASTFMRMYIKNYVEGLFLSSGVIEDADSTTEKMLETINILREKYKFHGYIHFKALPGVNRDLIKQASDYSDRISINLEAPNKSRLSSVSEIKDYRSDILRRQSWIKRTKIPSGQTTQLVVGSTDESDKEILNMMRWEYDEMSLRRMYFSAFEAIPGTKLEKHKNTPHQREVRLYNSDWLYRVYGFKFKEITQTLDENNNLPKIDPKIIIARNHFDNPIDVNEASYDDLIRIPGIGPTSANRILRIQQSQKKIKRLIELKNLGVVVKRAMPFLEISKMHQKTLEMFA